MENKELWLAWSMLLPPWCCSVPLLRAELTVNWAAEMPQAKDQSCQALINTPGWWLMASVTPAALTPSPGRSNELFFSTGQYMALSSSVHELGILAGKSRRKRENQPLPAARAIPAERIMRVCPVSLSEGHSQAKCTLLFSISITAPSVWVLLVHVWQTSLLRAHIWQQEESKLLLIFLWQEKGSQTRVLKSDPCMLLVQRDWWCKSMARADQVRPVSPCTRSSTEQLCTHWMRCPTP